MYAIHKPYSCYGNSPTVYNCVQLKLVKMWNLQQFYTSDENSAFAVDDYRLLSTKYN